MPTDFGVTPPSRTFTACFSVHAPTDPTVVSSVAGVFAKRGLVPSQWYGTVVGPRAEEIQIDIQIAGVDAETMDGLARGLRRLVCVESVLAAEKQTRLTA